MADTTIINIEPAIAARFEIIRPLGEGAAGAVYLARDLNRQGSEVALKLLLNQAAFDENTMQRFCNEWEVCQSVRHPNLVEAYDLIQLSGTVGFTMEYVPGSDLGRLCRGGKLNHEEVERIFEQVLLALQELHQHGICHRDVKLENILVRNDGVVKLSDLGLMKQQTLNQLTRTGVLLGTAQYMPPEYIKESKFDNRGDIYATGIALYEVLSGKRRLHEFNGMQAMEHLLKTNFDLPLAPLQGTPPGLLDAVVGSTKVDPRRRFQSAAEMLAVLKCRSRAVARPGASGTLRASIQICDFGGVIESQRAASRSRWRLVAGLVGLGVLVSLLYKLFVLQA